MLIGILSDIHDNLANLQTALDYCKKQKVEALFILGDLTDSDTLVYLADHFAKTIYIVQGNCEYYEASELKQHPQIINLGRRGGIIEFENPSTPLRTRKIGLCHEPALADNLIKQGAQIIFYGHTHKPWTEKKNGAELVNPGNIANVYYSPSFALWNSQTNALELKLL